MPILPAPIGSKSRWIWECSVSCSQCEQHVLVGTGQVVLVVPAQNLGVDLGHGLQVGDAHDEQSDVIALRVGVPVPERWRDDVPGGLELGCLDLEQSADVVLVVLVDVVQQVRSAPQVVGDLVLHSFYAGGVVIRQHAAGVFHEALVSALVLLQKVECGAGAVVEGLVLADLTLDVVVD